MMPEQPYVRIETMVEMLEAKGFQFETVASDDEHCVVRVTHPGGQTIEQTYTIEDAERTGLARRPLWLKWRKKMLYITAMRRALRELPGPHFVGHRE